MKYFIVNGFIPQPHPPKVEYFESGTSITRMGFSRTKNETRMQRAERYRDSGWEIPRLGANCFLRYRGVGSISVFVFGVFQALFLIKSTNQRRAYILANALRSFLTTVYGKPIPDNHCHFLLELKSSPDPDMSIEEIANLVKPIIESSVVDTDLLVMDLQTGSIVDQLEIKEVCEMISAGLSHPRLLEAVQHLEYSYYLIWGFMTGSYYEFHYKRDRVEATEYELEKLYYEYRIKFDLAFLSAFRGLEALLGVPFLKRHDIGPKLTEVDKIFQTSFATEPYTSFHEIFSSGSRTWSYESIIHHFLVLRNSVAAHANVQAPRVIMEDQVLEIQLLIKSMLLQILAKVQET